MICPIFSSVIILSIIDYYDIKIENRFTVVNHKFHIVVI